MYGSWDWGILGCDRSADIIDVAYGFEWCAGPSYAVAAGFSGDP